MKNFIRSLKNFFIVTPHLYTIGNSSEEVYLSLIKARHEKRKVLFLTPFNIFYLYRRDIQCNSIIKVKSKYSISQNNIFTYLLRLLFSFFILFCRLMQTFLKLFFKNTDNFFRDNALCPRIGISSIYNPYMGKIDEIEDYTNLYSWDDAFRKPLNISNNFSNKQVHINKIFNDIGVGKKKYICLHIRSSRTYTDSKEAIERNANIENYYSAINYLIKHNYIVVRMGDNRMPRMNKIKGLIDYAHSKHNNQYNDQCLVANCSFYIGATSGIWGLAWLFEKDMIILNNPSWNYTSPKSCDIDMFKIFYDKKNKNMLKISDWITNHFGAVHFMSLIDSRYIPIENDPEEILSCIQNYLTNNKISRKQSLEVRGMIRKSALRFIRSNTQIDITSLYRFYLMSYLSKGMIDKSFYEKYFK